MTHNDPTDTTGDTTMTDSPTSMPAAGPPSQRGIGWLTAGILAAILVVIAGGAFAVRGLRGDSAPTPTPSQSASPSASPSAPPSPTTQTPEDKAAAEAQAAYREYLNVVDQVGQDGGQNPERLKKVAIGEVLSGEEYSASRYRGQKWRQIGDTTLVSSSVNSVSLKVDPATNTVPEVVLASCTDVSKAYAVDADGAKVRPDKSPLRYSWLVTIREYPKLGGWLVAKAEGKGVTSC